MSAYIIPTSGTRLLPDVEGGQVQGQTAYNPIFPGTIFTGPLMAGNILKSDGSLNLAGVGEMGQATANLGYAVMAQSCALTQATNDGTAGQFACPIVIPAQSQILRITLMVSTVWSGAAATMGVGSSQNLGAGSAATSFTTAAGLNGGTLGPVSATPGANANQIANWINIGNTDAQVVVLSSNTGNGVGILTFEYIQGNDASVTP